MKRGEDMSKTIPNKEENLQYGNAPPVPKLERGKSITSVVRRGKKTNRT
jgi:hypothetical protein